MHPDAGKSDFETLVNLHYEDLYRFAFSLSRNPNDACDLTQQAFTIFAEKGHQIREADRAKHWLFTTLYREFLRQNKRDQKNVNIDVLPPESMEFVVESDAVSYSEKAELMAVLGSLEEDQRAILSLFYLEQYPYKEIAEILGIPLGTVMSRLARAKSALRAKLEKKGILSGIKEQAKSSNQEKKDHHG